MTATTTYAMRLIRPGEDKFSGLSLGDPNHQPLKTFLKRDAAKFHSSNLAITYGAFGSDRPGTVVGYISLVCGEIASCPELGASDPNFHYKHYPAVKIARLAVHKELQGKGLGRSLTQLGIGIARDEISPRVGCRFVTLDAKKGSVDFYKSQGFTFLDSEDNKNNDHPIMFLDLGRH